MSKSKLIGISIMYALVFAALFVLLPVALTQPAHADTGPKPSVTVDFSGLPDEPCYGTLLSLHKSTGPWSVWDPNSKYGEESKYNYGRYTDEADKAAWQAFVDYVDTDGYYFLQLLDRLHENPQIYWGYYPPTDFKILLYFPNSGTFVSSGACTRYAFHSYFSVDASGIELSVIPVEQPLTPLKSYDYTWEILSLVVRILITITIELCIALMFGLNKKYQIVTILAANAATQIAFNVALYLAYYFFGGLAYLPWFIVGELLIACAEAFIYLTVFRRYAERNSSTALNKATSVSRTNVIIYAVVANLVSCGAGIALATFLPSLF